MTGARLVALATPFDEPAAALQPATPTCGGCCCCCCCLVTTATAATLTAVHLHHVASISGREQVARGLVAAGGALAVPLAVALAVALAWSTEQLPPAFAAVAVLGVAVAALYRAAGADTSTVAGAGVGIPVAVAAAFIGEGLSLGLLIYGQVLALVIPPVAGVALARRLRAQRG